MVKSEKRVNVLLVDDQPANLLALEAVLDGLNLNLVKANSGEEALQQFMREDYAVILLDVRMPEMDGFETAITISQRDPTRNTPIIFLTAALENEKDTTRAYAVGAIDYLLKPFIPSVLRTKVSILIDLYSNAKDMRELIGKLKNRNEELEAQNFELKTKL